MPNWKKLITSGSDALLNKLNVTNGITGSLFGSASWSTNALTSSVASTINVRATASNATFYLTMVDSENVAVPVPELLYTAQALSLGFVPITANPANSSITANNFIGTASLAGTASFAGIAGTASFAGTASMVNTIRATDNKFYFLTFVDSNNSTSTGELVHTQVNLTYNPSTEVLFATSITSSFTGNLLGTASLSSTSLIYRTGSNATWYIPFVDSVGQNGGRAESLFTTDGTSLYFNPSNGSLTTTSFTGSLLGTASLALSASIALTASFVTGSIFSGNNLVRSSSYAVTASYAITASYALSSPGVGGTPGGSNSTIQFNSQSAFGGTNDLLYEYDTSAASKYRLYHATNVDFQTTAFTVDYPASYYQANTYNNTKQHAGISNFQISIPIGTGVTSIYLFDAQGGLPGNLSMHGFKCDYSLLIRDGSLNKVASRVGTLLGAWSYDTSTPPVFQDTYVNGDSVINELGLVVFTLSWSGGNISLDMDASGTSVGYDIIFNGLFTNFGNSA